MMTCQEVTQFLDSYLEGSLPLWQRLVFRVHLLGCRDCRRYLDSYKKTAAAVRSLGETTRISESEVPKAPVELMQAILAARRAGNGENGVER